MAWVKIPPEHHPLFLAALPKKPDVETMKMFGGVCAKVNGHIFAGLFGLSAMVWLSESDRKEALGLKGAEPFDPMGNGQVRSDKVMLPARVMKDSATLRRWIARAYAYAAKQPAKGAKGANAKPNAKPAKKTAVASKKTVAKPAAPRPVTKKRAAKKPAR